MKFVNLTPHEVVVLDPAGPENMGRLGPCWRFPSSGCARVVPVNTILGCIRRPGCPPLIRQLSVGSEIDGLPESVGGWKFRGHGVARTGDRETCVGETAEDVLSILRGRDCPLETIEIVDQCRLYIVSTMVFEAAKDRVDLCTPDSGADAVRDEAGRIVAVRRLIVR